MTPLRPRFEGPAATASACPLAAAGPAPRLDLDTLARLLTAPAIDGEYLPGSCWAGVRRLRITPPTPGRHNGPDADGPQWRHRVRGAFAAGIAESTAGHHRVAIALSGGLDSLAVLLAARAHLGPHAVIAISIGLRDDTGRSAADVAATQIAARRAEEHHVLAGFELHRSEWRLLA